MRIQAFITSILRIEMKWMKLDELLWSLGVPARWRWKLADTYVKKYSSNISKMVLAFVVDAQRWSLVDNLSHLKSPNFSRQITTNKISGTTEIRSQNFHLTILISLFFLFGIAYVFVFPIHLKWKLKIRRISTKLIDFIFDLKVGSSKNQNSIRQSAASPNNNISFTNFRDRELKI